MSHCTPLRILLLIVPVVIHLLAFAAPARVEMVVQACFSPQGKCSNHVIHELELAKQEILLAIYAFTSDELAQAVVQARKRGVSIRVLVDREFDAGNSRSKGKFLESQKIPLRRVTGLKSRPPETEVGIMHHKFAVIDRRLVLTGSYNWTRSADSLNDENLLLFHDAGPLAEEYRKVFLRLWERKP